MTWRAISINKEIYDRPLEAPEEIIKMGKVDIALFLPPSDIPEFISPAYDRHNDIFFINFKYFDQEKEKELFSEENIRLLIGDYSGKPLRIEIKNVKKDSINTIQLTHIIREDISRLIEERINQLGDLRKISNLKCADEVLKENAEVLAEAAVAA